MANHRGIAYVAGPCRGNRKINCIQAQQAAVWLWNDGFTVLCPHLNSGELSDEVPEEDLMWGSLILLSKCDTLVLIPGWQESEGSRIELGVALFNGLDVRYWDPDQGLSKHPWQKPSA